MTTLEDSTGYPIYDLMITIRRFTRSTLMHQHAIAEKMNLNVTDAECIDFLMDMGPSTAGELAKVTRLTTGAITSAIDRLEKAGLVERDKDPNDRRKVIVKLVPPKDHKAKENYGALANDVHQYLANYNENELNFLVDFMLGLTKIYHRQTKKITEK